MQILRCKKQRIVFYENQTICIENPLKSLDFSGFSGPSDWFRTSGLVVPNHALYHLSYTRITGLLYRIGGKKARTKSAILRRRRRFAGAPHARAGRKKMFTNPFGFVHNSDIFAPYTLLCKQANLFFPLFSFFFFYTKRKRAAAFAAARFLRVATLLPCSATIRIKRQGIDRNRLL